jgi:hypothetical protein
MALLYGRAGRLNTKNGYFRPGQYKGLGNATDVVISGCSAGGLASYLHCDQWAEVIHGAGAEKKVRCMADSGIFLDHQDPLAMADGPASYENMGYANGMRWVWDNMVVDGSGVDQTCVAAFPGEEHKCFFAEHVAPFIDTPMFALQSAYDGWSVLGSGDGWMSTSGGISPGR